VVPLVEVLEVLENSGPPLEELTSAPLDPESGPTQVPPSPSPANVP
jgi:hypothetical protein